MAESSTHSSKLAINPPVFLTSAGLLVAFVAFGVLSTAQAVKIFSSVLDWVATNFGWLYVCSVAFFVAFALWLLFSRYAHIRLGDDDERPEFSLLSWFAMLFSAGMGIGLVFYGVAEPMMHYKNPPGGGGSTPEAASQALPLTFFHWGIHAWAIYVLMGLGIAYFSYRKKLPLSLRSCFFPLLGEKIHGPIGHLIDILAVFGTLFGLATSLGLGAMQVSAGLNHLFGMPHTTHSQLLLIAIITLAATVSLVTGVTKGIRRLSELNLLLAGTLLLFVFVFGPTLFIVNNLVENVGDYLKTIVTRTFHLVSLSEDDTEWLESWTLFYWGWWIAWSPFVGMFVARVSRGRTIREFILGVLLVPTAVTFVWFSVFGGTALHEELWGGGGIAQAVSTDVSTAIYVVLERLPLSQLLSFVAACVVAVFFVTSSDSASFVVDMITSGGHPEPPTWQRVFWATAEGTCASVLLYAGGTKALTALQAVVVAIGLPFCLVLLGICANLIVALRQEARAAEYELGPQFALAGAFPGAAPLQMSWNIRPSERTTRIETTAVPSAGSPQQAELPNCAFHRILVASDYSAHSLRAIALGCQLADRLGTDAIVDVLHVTPPPVDYLPLDEWIGGASKKPEVVNEKLKEAAQKALSSYMESLPAAMRQRIGVRLEVGRPYRVIIQVAAEGQYDLVVLGTQGITASPQVRLGSVCERVLRFSPCTVMTVR